MSVASWRGARGRAPRVYLDKLITRLFMVELDYDRISIGGHNNPRVTETIMEDAKKLLDKGYVRLVSSYGTELDIVNAARVSFDKESHAWSDKDKSLLEFLIREGHTSPFRHASVTFECYVPLVVARQHWKYVVASTMTSDQQAWNESSRRYITEEVNFYIPDEWRTAPENLKQGSGGIMTEADSQFWTEQLERYTDLGNQLYSLAVKQGMAPEQARLFLPAYSMYVRYRWTASVAAVLNFLDQRLSDDAQHEIQQLAEIVRDFMNEAYPHVMEAYRDRRAV